MTWKRRWSAPLTIRAKPSSLDWNSARAWRLPVQRKSGVTSRRSASPTHSLGSLNTYCHRNSSGGKQGFPVTASSIFFSTSTRRSLSSLSGKGMPLRLRERLTWVLTTTSSSGPLFSYHFAGLPMVLPLLCILDRLDFIPQHGSPLEILGGNGLLQLALLLL